MTKKEFYEVVVREGLDWGNIKRSELTNVATYESVNCKDLFSIYGKYTKL